VSHFTSKNVASPLLNAVQAKPAIEGGIIQSVVLVEKRDHDHAGVFRSVSLPGHSLNIILAGEVEVETGGRVLHLGPGMGAWYYENEQVRGTVLKVPLTFYVVNFIAPRFPPPPFESRTWAVTPRTYELLESLLEAWDNTDWPAAIRHLQTMLRVMQLMVELLPSSGQHYCMERVTQLWWELEAKLCDDLSQPVDMPALQAICRRSRRSIMQACRLAVGTSPRRRIDELRLSYARGLVLHSRLSMTEIALRVGYCRVQEFSREYHRRYGITPVRDRRMGTDR
jgi:AraC-like DNA-binding protein